MLALAVWQAKQEVKQFQTSLLYLASLKTPILTKRLDQAINGRKMLTLPVLARFDFWIFCPFSLVP